MPVVDTEVLSALNPRDPEHEKCLALLKETEGLMAPDTAVLEFQAVLRGRGRTPEEVRRALLAFARDARLLALQNRLEEAYYLSYLDSPIAASALALDKQIVSDDDSFDGLPEFGRTAVTPWVAARIPLDVS